MAILKDGDILHAEAFNNKADKADLDNKQDKITNSTSLTLDGISVNHLLVTKSINVEDNLTFNSRLQLSYNTTNNKLNIQSLSGNCILTGIGTPSTNVDAANKQYVDTEVAKKQNTLVSGTNIKSIKDDKTTTPQSLLGSGSFSFKTINGETLLGSGDISISTGGTITIDDALSATSTNPVQNKVVNSALSAKQDTIKSTDTLTIAGLRASDNSMTLFNDNCVVSMTDDALIINFI